jgi:hypothetical protein
MLTMDLQAHSQLSVTPGSMKSVNEKGGQIRQKGDGETRKTRSKVSRRSRQQLAGWHV